MKERVKDDGGAEGPPSTEDREVLLFGDVPAEVHRSLTRWGFRPTPSDLFRVPKKPGAFERGKVKGVILDARAEGTSRALLACKNARLPTVLYNNARYTPGEMYAGAQYRTYPGPEELRRAVSRLAACPVPPRNLPVPLEPFLDFLLARFGVVFPSRRSGEIKEAVRDRMTVLRLPAVESYLEVLARCTARDREPDYLMGSLTVGETFLYRTPAHYEELRNRKLSELLRLRPGEPLRALSAGCSTGEEAYCLAALLLERLSPDKVEVVGADVNRRALEVANAGRYTLASSIRSDIPGWLGRHLERSEDTTRVLDTLRRQVSFMYTNLAAWAEGREPGPVGYFDIIFCRNVLLYFEGDMAARITRCLGERLKPGGVLFLGPSETVLGSDTDLEVRTGPDCFYLERPDPSRRAPRPSLAERMSQPPRRPGSGPVRVPSMPPAPAKDSGTGKIGLDSFPPAPDDLAPPPSPADPSPRDAADLEALEMDQGASAAPEATEALTTGSQLSEPLIREGFRLLDQEDFSAARSRFERALRAAPEAVAAQVGLLFLAANSGEYSQAREGCRRLIEEGATLPEIFYLAGLLADLDGQAVRARQEFERALFLDPECLMARFRLAELLSREERWRDAAREARNLLEQLREISPGDTVPLSGGMSREALEALCLGLLKSEGGVRP